MPYFRISAFDENRNPIESELAGVIWAENFYEALDVMQYRVEQKYGKEPDEQPPDFNVKAEKGYTEQFRPER
jgi:hypothetical protein